MKAKFLITGADGQLARAFEARLDRNGSYYLALSHQELDIKDLRKVRNMVKQFKPDFILNCAAYNYVDKAETEWREAFLVNGIGVRNLALAAEESNAVLIHFSTDYVFDGEKGKPYLISDIPNPINKYGESKLLGEKFVLTHADRYLLVRVSWVFGDGKNSFPLKLLSWAKGKDELKIVDDQFSSPSYVRDIVHAVLDLISREAYGLYHVSNSLHCSRYEWAEFILEKVGWKGKLLPAKRSDFDSPAKRPRFTVLDNFPLEETIGHLLPDWKDATLRFLRQKKLVH